MNFSTTCEFPWLSVPPEARKRPTACRLVSGSTNNMTARRTAASSSAAITRYGSPGAGGFLVRPGSRVWAQL
eukprot:13973763-Heterocapsa_arctica.AAC.1